LRSRQAVAPEHVEHRHRQEHLARCRTPVDQEGGEAGVVRHRREQPDAAAGEGVGSVRRVALLDVHRAKRLRGLDLGRHLAELPEAVHLHETRSRRRGDAEVGLAHAERVEHRTLQHLAKRSPGDAFEHVREHVGRVAVIEGCPRLPGQWQLPETLDQRRERAGAVGREPLLAVQRRHRAVGHEIVGKTGPVRQQVLDGDRAHGIRESPACVEHATPRETRQPARDRVVEPQLARLDRAEGRDRDDRLGHRVEPVNGIHGERAKARVIGTAGATLVQRAAVSPDSPGDAGEIRVRDEAFGESADTLQPVGLDDHAPASRVAEGHPAPGSG